MRTTTGKLANEELERVAGGTHSLESIPGIGPYVTVFLALKDAFEDRMDFRTFYGLK